MLIIFKKPKIYKFNYQIILTYVKIIYNTTLVTQVSKRREIMLLSLKKFVAKCSNDCFLIISLLFLAAIFGSIFASEVNFYIFAAAMLAALSMFEGLVSTLKEDLFSLHHFQLASLYVMSIFVFFSIANFNLSIFIVFCCMVSIATVKVMRGASLLFKYIKTLKTVEWPFFDCKNLHHQINIYNVLKIFVK